MQTEKAHYSRRMDSIKVKSEYRESVYAARKAVTAILIISFILFLAIAALAVAKEGLNQFVGTFKSMNLWYLLLAFAIILSSHVIRYPKWSFYLKRLGVHIPTSKNFVIYMSMYSMDITPGRWGRAIVSYTINKLTKVKFAVTFPAVVADIFTDFLGFAIVADITAIIVNKFIIVAFFLTFLLMIPFLFVYVQRPFNYIKGKINKMKKRFTFLKKLDVIFYTATLYFKHNKKLGKRSFIYSIAITVPSMVLNGMALVAVMAAFRIPITVSNIPTIIFIFSSSLVLGMVTGIPGTLGVTDAALISQLQFFFPNFITFGIAAAITIVFRIVSVWFVQAFGFASLIYTLRYWD